MTTPPAPVQYFQWSQAVYESAIKSIGFTDLQWFPSQVAPEDIQQYGEDYWQDFYTNNFAIGLICHK